MKSSMSRTISLCVSSPVLRRTCGRRSCATHLRKRPGSFTAYDFTLRALDLINSLDRQTFLQARDFLDKAMETDRNFAMPVAWAARWHSLYIGQGWSSNRRADAAKAAELAHRAIALDHQNALALATYAHLKSFLFHDYDTALVYFDQALAACPNSSLAWILSSGTLSYVGRSVQAVRHAERGLRLSPFDQSLFYYYMFLGFAHYSGGNLRGSDQMGADVAERKPALHRQFTNLDGIARRARSDRRSRRRCRRSAAAGAGIHDHPV